MIRNPCACPFNGKKWIVIPLAKREIPRPSDSELSQFLGSLASCSDARPAVLALVSPYYNIFQHHLPQSCQWYSLTSIRLSLGYYSLLDIAANTEPTSRNYTRPFRLPDMKCCGQTWVYGNFFGPRSSWWILESQRSCHFFYLAYIFSPWCTIIVDKWWKRTTAPNYCANVHHFVLTIV